MNRWLALLAAPLMLTSCLFVPAKFVSTLDIRADRSFTFTYVGEVQLMKSKSEPAADGPPADEGRGTDQSWDDSGNGEAHMMQIATGARPKGKAKPDETFGDAEEDAGKLRELATALRGEYGYRSARYIGNRKLAIDYRISGRLDHAFVFPFNPDGGIMFPFLAIELRGKDRLRVKAPGFANDESASSPMGSLGGMGGLGSGGEGPGSQLDGNFTLTTSAEIVSQNQEDGAQTMPDGTKTLVWQATPRTREAPMAVLKVRALP
jgi:hypothetical protein